MSIEIFPRKNTFDTRRADALLIGRALAMVPPDPEFGEQLAVKVRRLCEIRALSTSDPSAILQSARDFEEKEKARQNAYTGRVEDAESERRRACQGNQS